MGGFEEARFGVSVIDPVPGVIQAEQVFKLQFKTGIDIKKFGDCVVLLVEAGEGVAIAAGAKDIPSACGGRLCECLRPVEGGKDREADFTALSPLMPGKNYRVAISGDARDARGFGPGSDMSPDGVFTVSPDSVPEQGIPVITEIMANPAGDESIGEYVELYNISDKPVDLNLHYFLWNGSLAQRIRPAAGHILPPGGFAVIGGSRFDPSGVSGEAVSGFVDGRLASSGISNSAGQKLEMVNYMGIPVSGYSGWLAQSAEGRSVERADPGGPDERSNWVTGEEGGTPGYIRDPELDRPHLVTVAPGPDGVSLEPVFSLAFDRPVVCSSSGGGCLKIFTESGCPAGKSAIAGTVVSGAVKELIEYTPSSKLHPGEGYWLSVTGVTDLRGHEMRPECRGFVTGVEPDARAPVPRLVWPAGGAVVPQNLSFFQVEFSEPVSAGAGALEVVCAGDLLTGGCSTPDGGRLFECAVAGPLRAGACCDAAVTGPVFDVYGNLARRGVVGRFCAGAGDDEAPPDPGLSVSSISRGGVVFSWSLSEAGILFWRRIRGDETIGRSGAVKGSGYIMLECSPAEGGCDIEAWGEDPSGNLSAAASVSVGASDLPPAIVLSEIMANPSGSDTTGEYVELYNAGGEPIDISGWKLAICGDGDGSEIGPDNPAIVAPGAFALLVTPGDTLERYPWEATVIRVNGLVGSISNTRRDPICLYGADGSLVSSYGGWLTVAENRSFWRINADLPDYAGNWSVSEPGGTPGSANF